jgi:WD40 repeat protein
MATLYCSRCSRVIPFGGAPPRSCPDCGFTFDNAADSTNKRGSSGELPETVSAAPSAKTIGRYLVQGELGAGGFGTVELAYDPKLDRPVAIKCPNERVRRKPDVLARFAREGRNAAQLRHPGIVTVYDVEENSDGPFIVSEFVKGEPFSHYLRRGRMSFRAAASMLAAITSAVQYAHSKKIVHRDIKPSNIMVDEAGNPRLMDFGLAKREDVDDTITVDNQIIGSFAYMSPEQLAGKTREIDYRTDIFSLGVIFYQLLTEKLPFRADAGRLRTRFADDEPLRPRSIDKQIPVDLETICLKAMERNPEARYQSAGELAEDLERWLRGEPILARHIGRVERAWRWGKRNPASAGLIASVALLLCVITIASGVVAAVAADGRKKEAEGKQVEATARRAAETANNQLADSLVKNQALLAHAYVEKGSRYIRGPQYSDDYSPIKALPWLKEAMKLDAKNPDRLVADRIRLQTQLNFAPRIERMWFCAGDVHAAGLSPKRDTFFVAGNGTVNIWSIEKDGPPIVSLVHPADVDVAAFSPDGKYLATASVDGVRIWEAESGKQMKGPLVTGRPVSGNHALSSGFHGALLAFSKSGDLLFTATVDGINQIWDVRTGDPVGAPILTRFNTLFADFADSERLVVLRGQDRAIRVHAARTGAEKYVLRGKGENYMTANVSPDGMTIASCSDSGDVILWKAVTGEETGRMTVRDVRLEIGAANFSTDGQFLATGSVDGAVRMWNTSEKRLLWQRQIVEGPIDRLQFSQDSSTLAVIAFGKRFSSVATQTGELTTPPITNFSKLKSAAWTDSSQRVLTIDVDGVARLWNIDSDVSAVMLPQANNTNLAAVSVDPCVLAIVEGASTVHLLRLGVNARLESKSQKMIRLGTLNIDAIALSDDGSRLAVSAERRVSIWDTLTEKQVVVPMEHSKSVKRMRFVPNGSLLVCLSTDGRAAVWDVASGGRLYERLDVSMHIADMDIDRNGMRCAVAAMKGVTVWELANGNRLRPEFLAPGFPSFVRFSNEPDRVLVGGEPKPTQFWDLTTGKPVRTLAKRSYLQCLIASHDRSSFLTGYRDGTARLWSSRTFAPISPAFEHPSPVKAGIIDHTGRWVVTLTEDSYVHLWDAQTGELLSAFSVAYLQSRSTLSAARTALSIPLLFFSADSRFVHLLTGRGMLVSIGLDVDTRSNQEIEYDVSLRSATDFDGVGGLTLLEPGELATRWRTIGRTLTASRLASSTSTLNRRRTAAAATLSSGR